MFIFLSLLVGLAVTGLSMLIHAVFFAPFGEEDSHGFRLTEPPHRAEASHSGRVMTAAEFAFFKS